MKRDNIDIEQKGTESNFVTSADVNVQMFLKERLLALLPGSSFVGEEGDEQFADTEYVWVVDPIDGTSNFIRDLGLSAISVGCILKSDFSRGMLQLRFQLSKRLAAMYI